MVDRHNSVPAGLPKPLFKRVEQSRTHEPRNEMESHIVLVTGYGSTVLLIQVYCESFEAVVLFLVLFTNDIASVPPVPFSAPPPV